MALIHVPVPWKRKPPLGVPKSHSHQLAQGLKAHWVMNEGGGATLADLSSSGNPGELTNGAAWTSGRTGPVVACDGSDAYILGSIDCTAFTALTISAWIKPGRTGVADGIFGWGNSHEDTTPFIFWYDNSSTFQLYVNGDYRVFVSIALNKWVHVVNTWDGTTHRLYMDAVEIGSYVGGATFQTGSIFQFGSAAGGDWLGQLDHIRLYNRALLRAEVGQLYIDEFADFEPTLLPLAVAAAVGATYSGRGVGRGIARGVYR